MGAYLLRRLAQVAPVLLLISAIVFLVVYLIPGDPATVLLGRGATPENVAMVRQQMGLDRPVHERYLRWLGSVLSGDLGQSTISRQPVAALVADAVPVTLYLALASMLVAVVIAVPAGTISALKHNTWADLACSAWALFGVSVPSYWLGLMLIYLFAVRLRWVPLQGYVAPSENLSASLLGMALPAVTLGVFLSGPLTRYLRAGILSVIEQEHVRVARAKGLSEEKVVAGHVLRNALIPFVTVLGVQFGYLLGGAVIIEQIFALPGVGRLAVQAIGNRDYPVVQGVVLLVAIGFVAINLVVDLLYAALDPRIRLGSGSA